MSEVDLGHDFFCDVCGAKEHTAGRWPLYWHQIDVHERGYTGPNYIHHVCDTCWPQGPGKPEVRKHFATKFLELIGVKHKPVGGG